jgi:hypothetical protein
VVLPLLKVAGTMFDEGVSHPLAREAHDAGHRPAPGKQTRTERIAPARNTVGGTSNAVGGTSDPVGDTSAGAAHDDPFAMHLIGNGAGQGEGDDLAQRINDARAFNLQHTREVVLFNKWTGGFYAPPGGGQFDPEDIMAWQGDSSRGIPETGKLDTITMDYAELEMKQKGNLFPMPKKRPRAKPGPVQPVPYPQIPEVPYPQIPEVPYPHPQTNYVIPGWFVGTSLELSLHQAEEDERRWTQLVNRAFLGRVTALDFPDRIATRLTENRDEQRALLSRMTIEAAFLQQVADNPWPATLGAMQVLKDRARERSESLRNLVALSPGPLVPATAIVVLGETSEELPLDLTDPNVRTFLDAAIARATDDVRQAYVKRKILPGTTPQQPKTYPAPSEPPPAPIPQPDTPTPSDAPFNPRLEDEADAVWNAMNFALLATRDGIAQAAAELKTRDDTHKFNPLFEVFLKEGIKEGVLEIFNQLLEGAGHGMKVFGMGWAGGHISTDLELIWEALRGVIAPGTTKEEMPTDSKIELFAQGEIRTQTSLQFRAHNQFLRHTKQEYRDAERDQPGFGLMLAKLDRAHWERQVGAAARTAHDKTLSKFAVVLAHEGVKGSSARGGTNVANTADMFHALGVLALEIEGYGPQDGFRVLSKRLRGIPAAARKHLERKTIRDVDIPIVARGPVFAQYKSFSPFQLILALGESHEGANLGEQQRVRNIRWDAEPERERARVWLARKGDPAVIEPTAADADKGAHKALLEDLGNLQIGDAILG